MLTIYGIFASRAVRPLWAAQELGVSYTHVPTPYQGGATRTPEFLALNPNGHIPVLVDERPEGRVVVWESMACALYLARHHGRGDGSDIAPANPAEDAEALRWAFWAMTELETDALAVLMHRIGLPPPRRDAGRLAAAEQRLRGPLAVLEAHLTQQAERGCSYLAAQRFTIADLCVACVVNWTRPSHELMQAFPHVHAWVQHCHARPAYQTLKAADKAAAAASPERTAPSSVAG